MTLSDLLLDKFCSNISEKANLFLLARNLKSELDIQVHSGVFHADDVCVIALFKALGFPVHVIRDFKSHEEADIVADVGKEYSCDDLKQLRFDHHQELSLRADGTKPSALGLVADWLFKPKTRKALDRFIRPIEKLDNGQELEKGEVNYFSFVATFNSCWNEGISQDTLFFQAVEMATAIWKRIFASIQAEAEATEIVADAIANAKDGFAVLAKGGMPWQTLVVKHNEEHEEKILRVGYMDTFRGQFNVQAVPDALGSRGMLQPLPEQWLGEDKPEGLIFCHQARFLAAFKDEESARKALATEA